LTFHNRAGCVPLTRYYWSEPLLYKLSIPNLKLLLSFVVGREIIIFYIVRHFGLRDECSM